MTQEQSIFVVRGRDKIGISAPADIRVSSVSAEKSVSRLNITNSNDHCDSDDGVAVKFGDA